MIDVQMPQLGESVAEGTVTKWLVREGDYVEREQVLLTVATDKADTEVRAPSNGRVAKLVAKEEEIVAKGGLLCQIDETATGPTATGPAAGAPAPQAAAPQAAAPQAAAKPAPVQPTMPPAPDPTLQGPQATIDRNHAVQGGPSLASPATRKLAREQGIDLGGVHGTGEQGRITQTDVLRAAPQASAPQAAPARDTTPPAGSPSPHTPAAELSHLIQAGGGFVPPIPGVGYGGYRVPPYNPRPGDEVVPFSRRRRITADHMVYSKQVSPHVVTVAEVDLFATAKLRDQHKDRFKKEGVPLTFLSFICAAVVKALREHPGINARVLDNSYVVLRDVNLGVAVDTPGGLVVPSIKHADSLSLRGIAQAIDELAQRAKSGKVTADDLAGTSFSVSNPGLKGNLFGGAIISQPNVGILRMGEIKKRPVVVTHGEDDTIAIHPVMFIALSYDHRIIDGVLANSFLWRVGDILSRAEFEVG